MFSSIDPAAMGFDTLTFCYIMKVLMQALRDFNMPKIVSEDVPVFLGLIRDLFPGLEVERQTDAEFEQIVRQTSLDLKLQPEDTFILKVRISPHTTSSFVFNIRLSFCFRSLVNLLFYCFCPF